MSLVSRTVILLALLGSASAVLADKAVFAGGCFWCVEAAYQDVDGVTDAVSGFTGGTLKNPSYSGNHQGHYEAVEVSYDPAKISYEDLLAIFWVNVDPFDDRGQFCDKGPSYLSAVFVADAKQRRLAEASLLRVEKQFPDDSVVTPILPAAQFWPVEEYHQDYYKKNPLRYNYYRYGCGRDQRLQQLWGEAAAH
jgi:peptide-methionine (S)-S-oxide reductase